MSSAKTVRAISGLISAIHARPHWVKSGESYQVAALDVGMLEAGADDLRIQAMWHDAKYGKDMRFATAIGSIPGRLVRYMNYTGRPTHLIDAIRSELDSLAFQLCPGERNPLGEEDTELLRLALRAMEPGASEKHLDRFTAASAHLFKLELGALSVIIKGSLEVTVEQLSDPATKARAVAAFLLFGRWQWTPWPAPERPVLHRGTATLEALRLRVRELSDEKTLYPDPVVARAIDRATKIRTF